MNEPAIKIDWKDLKSRDVEAELARQKALQRPAREASEETSSAAFIHSPAFYTPLAGGLGAFLAWALIEPNYSDRGDSIWGYLVFPTVTALSGFFIGASEGLASRNLRRGLLCGVAGLAVGAVGGAITLFAAGIIFLLGVFAAVSLDGGFNPERMDGLGLFLVMSSRSTAWALAALAASAGQGVALRSWGLLASGLVGGALGGALGGLVFDPIAISAAQDGEAWLSRGVGFVCVGTFAGLLIGVVQIASKEAWLHMRAGPLAGKQYILHRNPTVIGSSPEADVYIFKDPDIEPVHAKVHDRGVRFELEDMGTASGTLVNGEAVQGRRVLQEGDRIVVGSAILEFSRREAKTKKKA